jgi:hypothetical protein
MLINGMGVWENGNHRESRGSHDIVAIGNPCLMIIGFQKMAHLDNVIRGEINLIDWGTLME